MAEIRDVNRVVKNSFNTNRKHRVEVDYWENELYRPLHGGWSIPFQAIAYHFSDISGKIQFPAETIAGLDSVLLPAGWTWEANEEWKPDNVGKFGQVDSEGWSYASSFDALCEAAQSRSLRAERKVTNIFRRRRWTRRRVCTSDQQLRSFGAKVSWVEHLCCSMSEVVKRDAMSYSLLLQHKDARRTTCGHLVATADDSMRETADLLSGLCRKLDAMKQFLQEKAALEALYAEKLQLLARKWMSCGGRGEAEGGEVAADPSPSSSSSSSSSRDDDRSAGSERGEDGSVHHAGFFSTVSRASLAISERTKEFSEMLSGALPHDVDSLIQEASDALTECLQEGDLMRAEFVQAFKRAEQTFEIVRCCHEKFQDELLSDVEELQESVRHQCASASASNAAKKLFLAQQLDASSSSSPTASFGSSSSSSATAAAAAAMAAGKASRYSVDVTPRRASFASEGPAAPSVVFVSSEILLVRAEQPAPRRSMSTSVAQLFSSTASPGAGQGSAAGNPLAAVDSWMGFQQYRLDVVAADGVLLGYNAFCKSLVKKRKKIAAVLAEFLKGTLKIFANEQFRVWQDCATMLEAVGVATNMVLVRSDVDQGQSDLDGSGAGGQPDIDLSNREFDLCIRSGGGGGGSSAGSSQSSKKAYEKNLNLIMIQAGGTGTGIGTGIGEEGAPEQQSISSPGQGSMSWSPAVYQESDDHVRLSPSATANSSFTESGRHMNLSPSVFSDHSQLLPIAMAGLLEFSLVPHLDGARPALAADRSKMLVGLVVLTFNRVLHILRPSAVKGLRDYSNSIDEEPEPELEQDEGPDLSAVDPCDVLLSASMRNVHASPVFIPMDGFRDAFEVVFPWKTVAQLSSPAGGTNTANNNSNSNSNTAVVSSIVFVAENSTEVLRWIRKISNVFADFDMSAPPASDEEDEEEEDDGEDHDHDERGEDVQADRAPTSDLPNRRPEDPELESSSEDGGPREEEGAGAGLGLGQAEEFQDEDEDEDDREDDGHNLLFVGDVADEYCMGEM